MLEQVYGDGLAFKVKVKVYIGFRRKPGVVGEVFFICSHWSAKS